MSKPDHVEAGPECEPTGRSTAGEGSTSNLGAVPMACGSLFQPVAGRAFDPTPIVRSTPAVRAGRRAVHQLRTSGHPLGLWLRPHDAERRGGGLLASPHCFGKALVQAQPLRPHRRRLLPHRTIISLPRHLRGQATPADCTGPRSRADMDSSGVEVSCKPRIVSQVRSLSH
jgi:hypothetical protein